MDLDDLAARLEDAADRIPDAIHDRMEHVGALGVALIRGNATGRPGPRIITGDYWQSWRSETHGIPGGAQCTIGTDRPQGRRLEFGFFNMRDSLGRLFFQPPYPHVQPALPHIEAALDTQMREAVEEVFR